MGRAFALVLLAVMLLLMAGLAQINTALALPYLRFPWPAGHEHRIYGGWTYGCQGGPPFFGTHDKMTADTSTSYNADYYAIDFQFGPIDGSPLDVAATAPGTVVYRDDANDLYGNKVVIDHGGGYYSVYAHFQNGTTWGPGIVVGSSVTWGQVVGYAGGTGGYPVHLHFHMQNGLSAYRPEPLLNSLPSAITGFGTWGYSVENSGACAADSPDDPSDYWKSCPTGDGDCDGYPSSAQEAQTAPETYIGTDASQPCAATAGANNEGLPDANPPDFNDDRIFSGQDTGVFGGPFPAYNHPVSDGPFGGRPGVRFDFNGDGLIDGQDTGDYAAFFNRTCAHI